MRFVLRVARARAPLAIAAAAVVTFVLGALDARAGDGPRAASPSRSSRVVALAGGAAPVFGAPPARADEARALFVYLHGVCGLTVNGCGHFDGAPGWLVCPQAPARCAGGGAAWSGSLDDKVAVLDHAIDLAHEAWPASADAPVVLVGFSQGAYVAIDAAAAHPGRYAGLLLLGADTEHAAGRLGASRVARVGLASGAYDMMSPRMQRTPGALARMGVDARYASLGAVGHTYVAADGTDDALASLLAWVVPEEVNGAPPGT